MMLVTRDQRRGPESFAALLAAELRLRGLSVDLRSLAAASAEPGLGLGSFGRRPLGAGTLLRLRRELDDHDVVVAFGSKTLPACVLAGAGRPVRMIYQNIGDPLYWAANWTRRVRVRLLLRRTAAVAALTEQSATVLEETYGVPASRIKVIRNARSALTFRPAAALERRDAREGFALAAGSDAVVVVASLSQEKRVDLAIDAIALMPKHVRLLVAGDGPLARELRDHAATVAPGRVDFIGTRTDMVPVYWAADAVLLTSSSEGVPGALVEAALCGVPVVSTDVGYVRDVVVSGVTGMLVDRADPGALADALGQVLDRRREQGEQARRHGLERFALDGAVDDWLELIGSVLDGSGRDVAVQG